MDRFAEIRAFEAVARLSGFAAAAREAGQSRSTVNRLVMSLEERLGVQLLNRTTRVVSTTSSGQAFYERVRKVLDDLDEAEVCVTEVHDEAVGRMRVSAPLPFGEFNVSPLIAEFMCRHPAVSVELNLDVRLVDPVAEGYDLVIRIAEPDEETTLVDHRILALDYIVCASPRYLAARETPQHPADLKAHALLYFASGTSPRYWQFSGPEGPVRFMMGEALIQSNNMEVLRSAVLAGLGVVVLPGYAIRSALREGQLIRILPDYALPERMLQVIYPPSRHLSAKVRLLTDFLIEHFAVEG
ncbi:MAG: LysR family transcriptional regulator [Pseudomonadota bacterium]